MKYLIILLWIISFTTSGCDSPQKSGLSNNTFVSLLSELMIIDALNIPAELKPQMARDVFKFYNIDSVAFNRKITELTEEPGKWEEIYGKTQKNIGQRSYPAYYFPSADSLKP